MAALRQIQNWLDENFAALLAEHRVPGASLAVLSGDATAGAAAGVLSRDTDVAVTEDAVFQIGSITKVFTATLVMQLVDEGLVELDAPVRRYLPGFRVAEREAGDRITVRHLLTHTAGFEGDIFEETTRYDDAVERFVADILPDAAQIFPPGELFSYNNAGFVVLGRLVEVLRGGRYGAVLREHLTDPLGMDKLAIGADEAILRRAAVGHVKSESDTDWRPVPTWGLAHSNTPAGATPCLPAGQLIRLAGLHLSDGLAPDGTRLLSAESARAMRQPQVAMPRRTPLGSQLGLAWHLPATERGALVGHDGGTIGQAATLVTVPDKRVAVALLTNGGKVADLFEAVMGHLLPELADATFPPKPIVPRTPQPVADPSRFVGRYFGRLISFDVTAEDGKLSLTAEYGKLAEDAGTDSRLHRELIPVEEDIFAAVEPDGTLAASIAFVGSDHRGRARYLHNHRANPRVG